jgi:hypothetical protein
VGDHRAGTAPRLVEHGQAVDRVVLCRGAAARRGATGRDQTRESERCKEQGQMSSELFHAPVIGCGDVT